MAAAAGDGLSDDACPNRGNTHHTCTEFCRETYGQKLGGTDAAAGKGGATRGTAAAAVGPSAAQWRRKHLKAVVVYCDTALHLDDSSTKALYRRALAREQLGAPQEALKDMQVKQFTTVTISPYDHAPMRFVLRRGAAGAGRGAAR
jgi:hypothetical protein